nr:MAG TPA: TRANSACTIVATOR PROTEIN (TAT) (TAT EIAVY) REGULATION [Caudoviricetes sp.]
MQSAPALRCCFHQQLPIVFLYSIFFSFGNKKRT